MSGPILMQPINRLTLVELERVILCVRRCRMDVDRAKMELEERQRKHGDGYVHEALLHVDNDLVLLTSALVKLDTIIRKEIF